MFDASAFVGLPWSFRGRGPDSYDCWGLVRAALQQGASLTLPDYLEGYSSHRDAAAIGALVSAEREEWQPVAWGREDAMDVAVMLLGGQWHVGLIVRRGLMLHVRRTVPALIEPLSRYRTNGLELYRHRSMNFCPVPPDQPQ